MAYNNLFEENLRQVTESYEDRDNARTKLLEAMLKLTELQKQHGSKEAELLQIGSDLDNLRTENNELKTFLIDSIIERDEVEIRKNSLKSNIEILEKQIENIDRECNIIVNNKSLIEFFEHYSTANQMAHINKIQDNKQKLMKRFHG